jgi:DNA-directed RNA polymerase specialized sigma24 family protein
MINKFMTDNYDSIIKMAKKVCKGSSESEEVAHYCLAQFLEHSEAEALIERGEAMKFLSGMMHRSFHSSTSQYHTLYRQKGRVHPKVGLDPESADEEYDIDLDLTVEAIEGILEDMQGDNIELWYRSTLFRMYLRESNYSEIERQTGIPRTSISQAVKECKKYIKKTLHERGIN